MVGAILETDALGECAANNGDITGDGNVNVLDVVILANAVLTGEDLPAGDINGDGVNNVLDIVELVNILDDFEVLLLVQIFSSGHQLLV